MKNAIIFLCLAVGVYCAPPSPNRPPIVQLDPIFEGNGFPDINQELIDALPKPPRPNFIKSTLRRDFEDIFSLIPFEQVFEIVTNYIDNDEQVQEVFMYLYSEDYAAAWKVIMEDKEIKDLITYLQVRGVDALGFLNSVATFFNYQMVEIERYHNKPQNYPLRRVKNLGGFKGLLKEITKVIPGHEIYEMVVQKLGENRCFARFYRYVVQMHETFVRLHHTPEVTTVRNHLKRLHANYDIVLDMETEGLAVIEILDEVPTPALSSSEEKPTPVLISSEEKPTPVNV